MTTNRGTVVYHEKLELYFLESKEFFYFLYFFIYTKETTQVHC